MRWLWCQTCLAVCMLVRFVIVPADVTGTEHLKWYKECVSGQVHGAVLLFRHFTALPVGTNFGPFWYSTNVVCVTYVDAFAAHRPIITVLKETVTT